MKNKELLNRIENFFLCYEDILEDLAIELEKILKHIIPDIIVVSNGKGFTFRSKKKEQEWETNQSELSDLLNELEAYPAEEIFKSSLGYDESVEFPRIKASDFILRNKEIEEIEKALKVWMNQEIPWRLKRYLIDRNLI